MARKEHDREDILREATALIERIEFELPGYAEPIVVGFRSDGSASVFVGPDPVFQFNTKHELRRAFVAGKMIKAERGQLISLEKHRTATQVKMLRTKLDPASSVALLTNAGPGCPLRSAAGSRSRFRVLGLPAAALATATDAVDFAGPMVGDSSALPSDEGGLS